MGMDSTSLGGVERVKRQSTAPSTTENVLWIDTTTGGNNPKVYDSGQGKWIPVDTGVIGEGYAPGFSG